MNYKRTTLKNGVRLVTTHMPAMRSASIGFFFATGSRYEKDEVAGISHFIEHMLFKGSRYLSKCEGSFLRQLKAWGVILMAVLAKR